MQISQLTLAQADALLYRAAGLNAPGDPLFTERINQVQERYINAGLWKGVVQDYLFLTDINGVITLPWFLDSILAATLHRWPVPIFSEFNRFVPVGPGLVKKDNQHGWPFYDMGTQFCTVRDIPEGSSGKIRTTITDVGDVGNVTRYFGLDQNGQEIFDASGVAGESVTLANPTVDTVNSFSKLTAIQKERSEGRQTVSWVGSTEDPLVVLEPWETIPNYHRYQCGTFSVNSSNNEEPVVLKCRLKYTPAVAPTDFIIPDNVGALKFGLLGLLNEDSPNDSTRATAAKFWQDGYSILDQQLKSMRGGVARTVNFVRKPTRNSI
jgi:hypothetical protein